jgi:hypothetical protein
MPLATSCQLFLNKVRYSPDAIVEWDVEYLLDAFVGAGMQCPTLNNLMNNLTKQHLINYVIEVQRTSFKLRRDVADKYDDLIQALTACVKVTPNPDEIRKQIEVTRSVFSELGETLGNMMGDIMEAANQAPAHPQINNNPHVVQLFGDHEPQDPPEIQA